jgi:hypothetical protein
MFNVLGGNYCHCLPKDQGVLRMTEVGAAFDKAQADARSDEEELARLKEKWP